jgi:hypothetical protein
MKCETIATEGPILKVNITGRFSTVDGKDILTKIAECCAKEGKKKVLVNVTIEEGIPSTFERYDMGIFVSNLFRTDIIMAVVVKSAQVSRFSETVAHNRGTRIFITENEKEAVNWLNRFNDHQ